MIRSFADLPGPPAMRWNTPPVWERLEMIGVSVIAPERPIPEYPEEFIVSEIEKRTTDHHPRNQWGFFSELARSVQRMFPCAAQPVALA
jgi:hypothetical protein